MIWTSFRCCFSDIDECALETTCSKGHEKCVNLQGSYRCDCVEGYKRDGSYCVLDVEGELLVFCLVSFYFSLISISKSTHFWVFGMLDYFCHLLLCLYYGGDLTSYLANRPYLCGTFEKYVARDCSAVLLSGRVRANNTNAPYSYMTVCALNIRSWRYSSTRIALGTHIIS